MVRSILNSVQLQNLFYNLMAVLIVGGIIAMIIFKFAIERQEIELTIIYIIMVLGLFFHQYHS